MGNKKKEEPLVEQEEVKEEKPEQENAPEEQKPSETEELQKKVKEWEDKYLRLYAEYDNFKKRSQREKDARYADAVVDVVSAILPVSDNLDRALAVEVQSEDAKKVLEGVEMVKKQMNDILSKLEVSEIPAVGEEFDPNLHNAVMHEENEEMGENLVSEEFQKGYMYKDGVLRHSMVKVVN